MRFPGLNLGEWIRRMGERRPGWSPIYLDGIQPVGIVHDASALVPPLLAPTGMVGSEPFSGPGGPSAWQFYSNAPGGSLVTYCRVGAPTATFMPFRVGPPLALTNPIDCEVFDMGPIPVLGRAQQSIQAGFLLSNLTPAIAIPNNQAAELGEFYVPPGQTFFIEGSAVNLGIVVALFWREFVATVPGT